MNCVVFDIVANACFKGFSSHSFVSHLEDWTDWILRLSSTTKKFFLNIGMGSQSCYTSRDRVFEFIHFREKLNLCLKRRYIGQCHLYPCFV